MVRYEAATRAQALGLKIYGVPNHIITQQTGIPSRTINNLWDRAISRGFDPTATPPVLLNSHVEDGKSPGRPRKQEVHKEEVLAKVHHEGRNKKGTGESD